MTRKPIPVKCRNCGYEWKYKGEGFYALCTRCRRYNNFKEQMIKAEAEVDIVDEGAFKIPTIQARA